MGEARWGHHHSFRAWEQPSGLGVEGGQGTQQRRPPGRVRLAAQGNSCFSPTSRPEIKFNYRKVGPAHISSATGQAAIRNLVARLHCARAHPNPCSSTSVPGAGSQTQAPGLGGAGVWGIERQKGRTPRSLPGPACCSDILAAKGQASRGHRRTPWTSVAPVQRSRPQSGDHAGSNSGRRQHGPESPPNQSSLNREEDVHVTSAI